MVILENSTLTFVSQTSAPDRDIETIAISSALRGEIDFCEFIM